MPNRLAPYVATIAIAGALSYSAATKRSHTSASAEQQQHAETSSPSIAEIQQLCTQLGGDGSQPDCLTHFENKKVGSLIATVADPNRTDLALYFDRSVEALIWAVGDVNYTFQSYWFPWQTTHKTSTSNAAKDNDSSGNDEADRTGLPGFLLFRGMAPNEFFIVWLVGESPTEGVEKPALDAAIHNVQQYDPKSTLRIVAPSFSGSFLSLGDVLNKYPEKHFQVITGMATSLDAENDFRKRLPRVEFGATVENSSVAFCGFIDYLNRQWIPTGEIALLAEDQTVYGQQTEKIPCIPASESAKEHWLRIRFPRQIARLRNSAEQQNVNPIANPNQTPGSPTNLPFTLKSPAEPPDNVPTYSPESSPLSQEAVLLEIAYALQREHVRYAMIVATDVLDQIFLTRFLHRACPDVRLVVLDSDLLFARAELTSPLEGVLSVTTYPLFLRNQHWTSKELHGLLPRRVPFANRAAEGTYNAARYELWKSGFVGSGEAMLDYAPPDDPTGTRPALWLTVLGKSGYWPVALLPRPAIAVQPADRRDFWVDGEHVNAKSGETLHPETPSAAWKIVLILSALFGFLNSLYIWFVFLPLLAGKMADHSKVRRLVSLLLFRMFWIYPRTVSRGHRRLFVVLTLAVACAEAVFVVAGVPYVLPSAGATIAEAIYFFVVPAVCWLVLLGVSLQLSSPSGGWPLVLAWAIWAAITAAAAHTIFQIFDGDMRAFFFAYRSSHPTSGVAPALPLFILIGIFFLWGLFQIWRQAEKIPPEVPALREPRRSADKLNAWLPQLFPLGPLPFVAVLIFFPFVRLRSVENRWYEDMIALLLVLSSFLMFSAWGQLLFAWRLLRRFLEALERHAMRDAFTRLPKQLATLPLLNRGRQKPFLMICARCCDTLRALKDNRTITDYGALRAAYDERAETLRSRLGLLQAFSALPDTDFYSARQMSDMKAGIEQTILETANALIERARTQFWSEGKSDSLDLQLEKSEKSSLDGDEKARVLAEEFIALRITMYILYALDQMKKLMWFVVISFVLMVLALNVYPFESPRLIGFCSIAAFLALSIGTMIVLAQMDRDPMLSRLTDTEPNQIGKNFFVHVARFGVLPLITVLSTEFPSIGGFLFSWIQPALQALGTSG